MPGSNVSAAMRDAVGRTLARQVSFPVSLPCICTRADVNDNGGRVVDERIVNGYEWAQVNIVLCDYEGSI